MNITEYTLSNVVKRKLREITEVFGRYLIFLAHAVVGILKTGPNKHMIQQMEFVGNRSLFIIILAGAMIGGIFGLQLGDLFKIFGAESMMGAAAAYTITKELAPVIGAMLVTGRAGSSMTAQIATMRINEQIDAIKVMGVDPIRYLVTPRVWASALMLPVLASIFILVGVSVSYLIAYVFYDINLKLYVEKIVWVMRTRDVIEGLEKAMVFGILYSSIGCFKGFYAKGGAKGVGSSTTSAVVTAFIVILLVDFAVTYIQYKLK